MMTVLEYIAKQPEPFRSKLEELRALILSVAPDATESVSYKVPCFRYLYWLVGMGVTKKYCSLYIMGTAVTKKLKEEGVEVEGSTIHFPPDKPLPVALIKRIVKDRMKENEARALAKMKK
ncbi:Uncharacterized conserved protein YdhG, YjbR/CyaY-like superfamily, DUF1801 family [Chitinophaga sp. YR573]|uniref:iron chaperone n=1 Tax=Chitinophaga sp. YR573 TaxID=1881040 RepID=UPI0008CD0AFB|nr:DUF1801 domain-containing protein [Chitinophaga sp. YR573]SEW34957.1 Uncharacterized conserved protein YdhG, YjbR/CyaY-like superfamily, DUF1801 family [Chitinophaga sp. YR573]